MYLYAYVSIYDVVLLRKFVFSIITSSKLNTQKRDGCFCNIIDNSSAHPIFNQKLRQHFLGQLTFYQILLSLSIPTVTALPSSKANSYIHVLLKILNFFIKN
jgi:hypothetical protein